jgi:hypothetical protein
MIEGFLRGRGQPPAPDSDTNLEVVQPQARSQPHWNVVWIISSSLVIIAAGFGLRYYLSHRSFLVTGEILYRPEVQTEDGTLQTATQVIPVQGAEVIVYGVGRAYREEFLPDLLRYTDKEIKDSMPAYIFDPRRSPNFESLAPEAQDRALKEWDVSVNNWNERLHLCYEAVSQARKPESVASTYTDARGQFTLKLKQGTYMLFASGEVPSFLIEDHGRLSPTSGYAWWQEQLKVAGNTNIVTAQPACAP